MTLVCRSSPHQLVSSYHDAAAAAAAADHQRHHKRRAPSPDNERSAYISSNVPFCLSLYLSVFLSSISLSVSLFNLLLLCLALGFFPRMYQLEGKIILRLWVFLVNVDAAILLLYFPALWGFHHIGSMFWQPVVSFSQIVDIWHPHFSFVNMAVVFFTSC